MSRQRLLIGGGLALSLIILAVVGAVVYRAGTQPTVVSRLSSADQTMIAVRPTADASSAGERVVAPAATTTRPVPPQPPTDARTSATDMPLPAARIAPTNVAATLAPTSQSGEPLITPGPIELTLIRRIDASGYAAPSISGCAGQNQTTFEPTNALDGVLDTAWRVPGDGRQAFLLIEFQTPLVLTEIQIVPGYAKIDPCDGTNRFFQNRRVRQVEITFSDGVSVPGEFRDSTDFQSVLFEPHLTEWVRITVLETYTQPAGSAGRDFTPISEVRLVGGAP